MTTIFTSDPHGTGDAWVNKVNYMYNKYPSAEIVFGGDYIDGRNDSKQVLNYIRQIQNNHNAIVLIGNHDDMLKLFLSTNDRYYYDGWRINGANSTVKSLTGKRINYRTTYNNLINYQLYDGTKLLDWLNSLKLSYVNEDGCYVHAYVSLDSNDINENIKNTNRDNILWNRELAEDNAHYHNNTNKSILFGHTPTCLFSLGNDEAKGLMQVKYKDENIFKQSNECPIIETYREGKKSLIACDGGCHGGDNYNTGNVVVVNKGKIIDWLN